MSQPDGSYPRLNGAMLGSGKYNGKIVSLVGKFDASQKHFECCDKMTVELDTAQADGMQIIPGTIAEIVGLVQSPSNLMVSDEEVCDIVLVCLHELRGSLPNNVVRSFVMGTIAFCCFATEFSGSASQ